MMLPLRNLKKQIRDYLSIDSIQVFARENLGVNRRTLLLILSAVVGVLVSFIALFLKIAIEKISHFSFSQNTKFLLPLIPGLGGLLVGILVYRIKKTKQGGGVEETIKIIRFGKTDVSIKDVFLRFITSAITLGSGGSAGKEAPVVHLGGGMGFLIGKFLNFPSSYLRTLSAAGVAAAIAAAFNTPIAGSFFALEILLADFTLDTFAMIVIAAVASMSVTQSFDHLTHSLYSPVFEFQGAFEYSFYIVIGVLGGITNVFFIKMLQEGERFFSALKMKVWLKPALGGLLLGMIELFLPAVMGEGYSVVNLFLSGNFSDVNQLFPSFLNQFMVLSLVSLLLVKMFATMLTVSSGGSGGTIFPALFLGANVGAIVAAFVQWFFPTYHFSAASWSLAGIISVLAAMTHAPIFSIMLFFELTQNFEAILPVLLVVSISILVSRRYQSGSLYSSSLEKEGIQMYKAMEQSVVESVRVEEVMHKKTNLIDANTSLANILKNFLYLPFSAGVVIDNNKRFLGVADFKTLKKYMPDEDLCNLLVASEVAYHANYWLLPEDSVLKALELMDEKDLSWLPVLNNNKEKYPVGFTTRKEILKVYNQTIANRSTQNIILQTNQDTHSSNLLNLGQEFHIDTIHVPATWDNKTIKDLNLRAKYNLTVIGIRPSEEVLNIVPDILYKLKTGDQLTYVGKSEDIENFYKDLPKEDAFFPFTSSRSSSPKQK